MREEPLPKLWGSWEPTVKGNNGRFTLGLGEKVELTISDINIQDYIFFINDLKHDLEASKLLLERMNVLITEESKDV